jgi:transposase
MSATQLDLIEPRQDDRTVINGRCFLRQTDGWMVLFVNGQPVFSYDVNDVAASRLAMVQLVVSKAAQQQEVARAFGVKRVTVRRQVEKYQAGGVATLVPKKRGPKGPRLTGGRTQKVILKRKEEGESNCQIAQRLGISEASIRLALKRAGYVPKTPVQAELPAAGCTNETGRVEGEGAGAVVKSEPVAQAVDTLDEPAPSRGEDESSVPARTDEIGGEALSLAAAPSDVDFPVLHTLDTDPSNRAGDRCLARMGLLDDAAPLFQTARSVPQAGALLGIAVLVTHGVFADARTVFAGLGAAFYGLRNVVLTLVTCILLGINRPENLKRHSPASLGQVLGLDRPPEMKTLRRKIRALALQERSLPFARVQLKRHLSRLSGDYLWVYVDGHVSVYCGKRRLDKHHVTRLRISLPSVLDYWVNDGQGDPLLVFTGRPRKGMTWVLRETIRELRSAGESRTITLVFDREGWSPALFAELSKMEGVRFVTYRKARRGEKLPRLAATAFSQHSVDLNGETLKYDLADNEIHIDYGPRKHRKRLKLRQVTRRGETGKQTHIVTNERQMGAMELACRMFGRWGQENYFKYMGQRRDFDGLVTYLMEDADAERMVPNPERAELREELIRERCELQKLSAAYGSEALQNQESARPTMRGFKIANGQLGQRIGRQRARVQELEAQLKKIAAKVPLRVVLGEHPLKKAHVETRRLMHVFRMAAHKAESGLRELFRPVCSRWFEESREMVRTFLNTTGDIHVKEGELLVTLNAQSAPHRTQVLAHLCAEVNTLNARFPGSDLVLRFRVQGAAEVSGSG